MEFPNAYQRSKTVSVAFAGPPEVKRKGSRRPGLFR
jgi:hypothetical protein